MKHCLQNKKLIIVGELHRACALERFACLREAATAKAERASVGSQFRAASEGRPYNGTETIFIVTGCHTRREKLRQKDRTPRPVAS